MKDKGWDSVAVVTDNNELVVVAHSALDHELLVGVEPRPPLIGKMAEY